MSIYWLTRRRGCRVGDPRGVGVEDDAMKALSLWQPWASLMALGLKKVETRSWYISHRGPLIIASCAKWDQEVLCSLDLARKPPVLSGDFEWRMMLEAMHRRGVATLGELPLGAALCIVNVVDCLRIEEVRGTLTEQELAFGDYRDGRWVIITKDCQRFPTPIPCRGKQGLWEFVRPLETEG